MAALCGPSNALSSLQKHTSADRGIHQDRFRAGPPSLERGFRSTASAPNEVIENEFQAFARGVPLFPVDFHAQQQGWVNDFQRLGLQQQQQQQQQQPQLPQPDWGLEFVTRLQQLQQQEVEQQQQPQQQQQQQESYKPMTTSYPAYVPAFTPAFSSQLNVGFGGMGMALQQQQQPETITATEFQFDESVFEKAFADAAREVESGEPEVAFETITPKVEKGKEKEKEPFGQDSDDLARTAGQLLDSVRQDTSEKFQNSNFLALMRKLRDHEVVVEGDKMVETRS